MSAYMEDCISLTPTFGVSDEFVMFEHPAHTTRLVYACDMEEGEMQTLLSSPSNKLSLQRNVIRYYNVGRFLFRPSQSTLEHLHDLYYHNYTHSGDDRGRFSEVAEICSSKHTLEVTPTFRVPLYLKHPETGAVTLHKYPYTSLPSFTLRTAHPVLVSHKSYTQLIFWGREEISRDILYTNGTLSEKIAPRHLKQVHSSLQLQSPSPIAYGLSRALQKRRRPEDLEEPSPAHPPKRSRSGALSPIAIAEGASLSPPTAHKDNMHARALRPRLGRYATCKHTSKDYVMPAAVP